MSNVHVRSLLPLFLVALAAPSLAEEAAQRPVGRVAELALAPTLDGHVAADPAWDGLASFTDFVQLQPDNGEPATLRTEVYIGFTGSALYMGVICYDDPELLTVSPDGFNSDAFTAVFDTFRNQQTGLVFGTNPIGAEYDGQSDNDWPDWNWSTVWEVRSRIHDEGWSAEFEIPFTSLRYGAGSEQSWGVNFARVVQRNNEISYWSPVPRQLSMYRLDLAGVIDGFRPPRQRRNLKFMPYALGSFEDGGDDSHRQEDAGFDVKYSLTPSLTLDLTYNTDFAQVESDRQQVNFGRFSLFFPETRPFFLENSGAFEVGSPGEAQLFHSRRIGIGEGGERLPIDGGVRVSGKVAGTTNLGLLHMRADSAADTEQSEFSVVRVSRDLRNRSSIGAIATNRGGDVDNQAFGLDGRMGIGEHTTLQGYAARSRTPGLSGDDHALSVFGGYDSPTWAYNASYGEIGANFNPEIGFVARRDYRRYGAFVQRTFAMDGRYGLNEWKPHAAYTGHWGKDGFHESGFLHLDSWFVWRNGADVWTALNLVYEGVREAFSVAGREVAAGEYDNAQFATGFNTPSGKDWRLGYFMNVGGYYDGERLTASPFFTYQRDEILFSAGWTYNAIELSGESLEVNLVRASFQYSFTPKVRVRALLQYNDADDVLAGNFRFSWLRSANAGLYLVYNEVDQDGPASLRRRREIALKYSHIFDVL